MLQAARAGLIQPGILLLPPLLTRERGGVSDFSTDMVKDGKENGVKNAGPERLCKRAPMVPKSVKEDLHGRSKIFQWPGEGNRFCLLSELQGPDIKEEENAQ
jgi:hypothetical protein